MSKVKLFCFPYAGGSATIYNKWRKHLREEVELIPVELPGRGKRINEAFYRDIPGAVEDVLHIIRKEVQQSPYALFGHSMGAMIAYHLAQKIGKSDMAQPVHVFISGRGAPSVRREDKKRYSLMNDEEFLEAVIDLGGTSEDFLQHPELVELFFPLLRNDFQLSESEATEDVVVPLDSDITVLLGKDEDLTAEQCTGWRNHTEHTCNMIYFNGGHFFIHEETEKIAEIINSTCLG